MVGLSFSFNILYGGDVKLARGKSGSSSVRGDRETIGRTTKPTSRRRRGPKHIPYVVGKMGIYRSCGTAFCFTTKQRAVWAYAISETRMLEGGNSSIITIFLNSENP